MTIFSGLHNSILNNFISELRNVDVQTDSMRFRSNLERIGEIFAYEISKTFDYEEQNITTPLGNLSMNLSNDTVVIASILRAALPLHQGFLNYFDKAENAFISAYRNYRKDDSFDIHFSYATSPPLNDKILILVDTMLATGSSMALTYKNLLQKGTPKHTHIVSIVASKYGVENFKKNMPQDSYTLWLGAVDDELNEKSYIVPGLGDAGDLAYGEK